MYQSLGSATLKTGETVDVGVITPPDLQYHDKLMKLLGHKGWEWVWQVEQGLDGSTDTLENRFYVARRDDELISNICTFEVDGVGILGHVWTPPEERRKGLCSRIFDAIMPHLKKRKVRLMLLGTGYDTPPYHIYRRYGFEGYYEGSGLMRWGSDDNFEKRYFRRSDNRVVKPSWSAWPRVNALVFEAEEYIKSIIYGKFYKDTFEDAWLYVLHSPATDQPVKAKLLESEKTGAITGCVIVAPDKRFPGTFLMDLYCHPKHVRDYGKLLDAVDRPGGKVVTYVEKTNRRKAGALKAAGFVREATLKDHLQTRDGFADLYLFARSADA